MEVVGAKLCCVSILISIKNVRYKEKAKNISRMHNVTHVFFLNRNQNEYNVSN